MPGAVVSAFERWYFRDAPPERLAVIRILVGAFATVYAAIRVPDLWKYAAFSDSRFHPVGISGLLDGPLSPAVWHALLLLTVPLCVAFTLGWHHKVVAPIAALVLLAVTTYHDSFGQLFHTENLMVLYVIVLAVVPAADALSLDRRRAAARDVDAADQQRSVRMARGAAVGPVCHHVHARRVGEDLERRMGMGARRRAAQPDRLRQRPQGGDG